MGLYVSSYFLQNNQTVDVLQKLLIDIIQVSAKKAQKNDIFFNLNKLKIRPRKGKNTLTQETPLDINHPPIL